MTLALADTSVWARSLQPEVAELLSDAVEEDRVVMIAPVVLELLRGTRDMRELERDARRYDMLPVIHMTPAFEERARDVQRRLAWRGYHLGPSAVDLLAATAALAALDRGWLWWAALGAQGALLAAAAAGVGIARYYVLVTWATVVSLRNYLRRGVPATWDAAEGAQ